MRFRWLMVILALVALSVSLVSIDAQDAAGRDKATASKAAEPKGLHVERAIDGQEPTWWVKANKPSLDVNEYTLDNGLKVLILDHGVLPLVTTFMWYNAGSSDESVGATGVAHFLEHMMFKGSKNYLKGDIDAITAAGGGSNNAATGNDYTNYYFNMPKATWTQALDIEVDRMTTLALAQKEFDSEKKVVQEEYNRSKDNPSERIWEALERRAYGPNHPYAHPVLGFEKDLAALEVQDMRRFYERFYTPDNATLVVVGRIDPDEALKEITTRFAKVPRGRFVAPRITRATNPVAKSVTKSEVTIFAEVAAASGMMVLPTESTASVRNPVRDVLADILTSGENSRLYQRLVVKEGLVAGVGAFNYERHLAGSFFISFSMLPRASDADRERVIAIVREEIAKLAAEGPTAEEIKRAVVAAEASSTFALESREEICAKLGEFQTNYGDWRFIDHYLATIKEITPADVKHVCSLWDFDKELLVGWTLPQDRANEKSRPIEKAPEMPTFQVKEVVLENGLKLILLPSDSGPEIVSIDARFEAGTRTQAADKNGLAALTGSLIDAGTATRTRAQIAKAFEDVGGQYSASASGLSAKVLKKDLGLALDVFSDILMHANFPEDQITIERRNLLARIAQLNEDHAAMASRAASRMVYGADHPFGTAPSTNAALVAAYTRADLMGHFARFVAPNNTRIIVAGRFDADAFATAAKAAFKDWAANKGAEFRRTAKITEPERHGVQRISYQDFDESKIAADTRVLLIDHPDKDQCVCRLQRVGFARTSEDYAAAKVMDAIFGTAAGFSDRVSRTLRDELGLAYTTYANLANSGSEEPGAFLGYIATSPSSVPQALVGFRTLIDEIASTPVSEQELKEAKSSVLAGLVFGLEGNDRIAAQLYEIDRYGLGWDYLPRLAKAIEAETIADVEAVAKKYLDSRKMILVVAGPIDQIPNADTFFEAFANDAKLSLDENNNIKFGD